MGTFRMTVELHDPSGLPEILRDVADRIEATPPERKVSGHLDGPGGLIGVFVLVDDDERWQVTMRADIDAERD